MDTSTLEEIKNLEEKLLSAQLPQELLEKAKTMLARLDRIAKLSGNYASEFDSTSRYLDWIINLPWQKKSQDTLDLTQAKEILNKNHFGLQSVKNKILEYLSVMKLTTMSRAPILLLVGLVGTGKTTLAYSIASAMNRKFERVPFGGIGDALYLRGQSRAYADAEPGSIIKALRRAQTNNPVILLDEIDRVAQEAKNTIMGVLVELLDPEQNSRFTDHFIDYPFDLSQVLFVATANNTSNVSTAVLDRLEPIIMPSYTDGEKTTIAKDFVLPKLITQSGLPPNSLQIDPVLWPKIVRPLGFDSGMRSLERTISSIVRKVARMIVENPTQTISINDSNLQQFLSQ